MARDTHRPDIFAGPDEEAMSSRLNWLRAGVLGANDGIVSIAAMLVGVAAATTELSVIVTAAVAGVVGGALSMGVGEFVSVSAQRDAEEALLERERIWQKARPAWEREQLVRLNMETGMTESTARLAATEQMEKDPIGIHARMHLGVDPDDLTNPWAAGIASILAFTVGGLTPLLTTTLPPAGWRVPLTFILVIVALAITGYVSAVIAKSPPSRAVLRNIAGGAIAMAITYGIGSFVGIHI
ncbi:VIT1/CCC1 transporter family protein [Demequina lignilytica]|uniref:VIT family protein n=1 Tax=Demequina lignilytica TaxID=3051663 RepID=A0AAW7M8A5_9MICO|nr:MULTISPECIES: VIT family protein [unclassified Demequina]MDN4478312.1 VIT family protein [Demequina sp. SYSU T00039-1]MDN4482533.1 VIT family protein [Demequina sp. SYSU T0a273]MDN4487181.1 VIT family protein [Demequina sp. SYSU T00039]MDN4489892.1 VIT family protein [Demequina sp. SYSU T00068]